MISFEVFPPKKEGEFKTAYEVVEQLSEHSPEFISVTYGAGGSKSKKTLEIASHIKNVCNQQAMAHMTCVGSTKEEILRHCQELENKQIEYVLALRGDRPKDMSDEQFAGREFNYATDLMKFIKENSSLHIMGACYPEGHVEALSPEQNIDIMKEKHSIGVEGFITQMFFDNELFYSFVEKTDKAGICVPIHAGIMPITSAKQLGTSVTMTGCSIPEKFAKVVAKYGENPEDMYKAGIDYAICQILELREHGIDSAHIYTMNKPAIAREIMNGIK